METQHRDDHPTPAQAGDTGHQSIEVAPPSSQQMDEGSELVVKKIEMDTHVMAHMLTILVHVLVAVFVIVSINNGRYDRAKSAGYFLLFLSALAVIPIVNKVDRYIIQNEPDRVDVVGQ